MACSLTADTDILVIREIMSLDMAGLQQSSGSRTWLWICWRMKGRYVLRLPMATPPSACEATALTSSEGDPNALVRTVCGCHTMLKTATHVT